MYYIFFSDVLYVSVCSNTVQQDCTARICEIIRETSAQLQCRFEQKMAVNFTWPDT